VEPPASIWTYTHLLRHFWAVLNSESFGNSFSLSYRKYHI